MLRIYLIWTFLWTCLWFNKEIIYGLRYLRARCFAWNLRRRKADHPCLWWDDNESHVNEAYQRYIVHKQICKFILVSQSPEGSVAVYIAIDSRGKLVYPPLL